MSKNIFVFLLFLLVTNMVAGQLEISIAEIKKENGGTDQTSTKIKKTDDLLVSIVFNKEIESKAAAKKYTLLNTKNEDVVMGNPNKNKLDFKVARPFDGSEEKELVFQIIFIKNPAKPDQSESHYQFKATLDNKVNPPPSQEVDLMALAAKLGFSLSLNDLLPTSSSCCDPDSYPCFLELGKLKAEKDKPDPYAKNPKNRIIYDAFGNQTYYLDEYGHPSLMSTAGHKYFSVKAGQPLAFEIINVNPSAYKVEISDTAENFFQQPDASLAKFLSPSGIDASAVEEDKKEDPAEIQRNKVRAGISVIIVNLRDFLLQLQYSCDHLHFKLIDAKIEAKKRVDVFLRDKLQKNVVISLPQFLINELIVADVDSTMYREVLSLYNYLPSVPYHMQYLKASIPYNKDRIIFRYNILARENTPYLDKARREEIPVYIKGNFKVDVSTGLYFAWLKKDNYSLRADSFLIKGSLGQDSLVNRSRLVDEQMNKGEFGFSSFLHFYIRSSPSFNWGGHIGVGISLDDQITPRYFTGLSFLIGRESGRIAVNFGAAFGNVDRISNQYPKVNGIFLPLPREESSVKYVKKFIGRPFISISYNLPFSLKKRTSDVEPPKEENKEEAPPTQTEDSDDSDKKSKENKKK